MCLADDEKHSQIETNRKPDFKKLDKASCDLVFVACVGAAFEITNTDLLCLLSGGGLR